MVGEFTDQYSCALLAAGGTVSCRGQDSNGEIGNGTTTVPQSRRRARCRGWPAPPGSDWVGRRVYAVRRRDRGELGL